MDQILVIAVTVRFTHPYLNKVDIWLSRPPENLWRLWIFEIGCSESLVILLWTRMFWIWLHNWNRLPRHVVESVCVGFQEPATERHGCSSANSSPCLSGRLGWLTSSVSFQLPLLWLCDCLENNVNFFCVEYNSYKLTWKLQICIVVLAFLFSFMR